MGSFWQLPNPGVTGPVVPSADSTADVYSSDVIGNKSDAAVTTVGTTAGIVAYIKGLFTRTALPSADSTANAVFTDVLGNKSDVAATAIAATKSAIAYLKWLLGLVQSTTSETGTDSTSGALGSIRQLVASSAAAIHKITLAGTFNNGDTANQSCDVYIMTGPGGSETTRFIGRVYQQTANSGYTQNFNFVVHVNLPAGTRVAWKPTLSAGNSNCATAYTIEEA